MVSLIQGMKIVLLDLDGTIHLGGIPIPGAVDFIQRCHENGVKTIFLSNNSSKSVNEYVMKLNSMGIDACADDILLSTHDCIRWLKLKKWTAVYCLGTNGMKEMMIENGIECVEDNVDCVVLGYDTELTYEKLSKATSLIHQNIPLVATHPDIVCPSPDGGLPDVGAILKMIELATGVQPGAAKDERKTWNEPDAKSNGPTRYPFNHVHESEIGHVHEIDDTPGGARLLQH